MTGSLGNLRGSEPGRDVDGNFLEAKLQRCLVACVANNDDSVAVDVHSLRTTFGTLLSKGGVSLRTAQEAMRHSDPSLTANVYTDPRLLNVHSAVEALPALPLDAGAGSTANSARATGTDDSAARQFAQKSAQTSDKPMQIQSVPVKTSGGEWNRLEDGGIAVTSEFVQRKTPQTIPVSGVQNSGRLDSNQRPLGPEPSALSQAELRPVVCVC